MPIVVSMSIFIVYVGIIKFGDTIYGHHVVVYTFIQVHITIDFFKNLYYH